MLDRTTGNPFRLHRFLTWAVLLGISLWSPGPAFGQVELAGSCPATCGIKIRITNAVISEANDGVLVKVDWTMDPPKPELKLTSVQIVAKVNLGIDNVENRVTVGVDKRTVTLKLSRNFEFDFKDVKTLHTEVIAFANPLPPIPVSTADRRIVGEGNDSAVEVTWNNPGPLPCTAANFAVEVSAINEKGDKLTGLLNAGLTARKANVDLKGALNKKGLRTPEASVKVVHNALGCVELQNFSPTLVTPAIGAGVGSTGPDTAKVTIKNFSLLADSGRVFTNLQWDVFEPTNFKVSQFDLKLEVEKANGQVQTQNALVLGNQRSFNGSEGIGVENEVRKVTVTVKATLRDNANTAVLTREDKRSATFSPKPVPILPENTIVKFDITNLKISSASNLHRVASVWQLQLPAGVTVTNFLVEATVAGTQNKIQRSAVIAGNARQGEVSFSFTEVGNQINGAQVKVTANLMRANGSTFQQTATRQGP
jgi:hypothetical protein